MTETRNLFDKFAVDQRPSAGEMDDISVELMTVPQRDEERERLEKLRAELDLERQRFTEAAIKLGKEKAELAVSMITLVGNNVFTSFQAERFQLIEEKRSWEVERMLADLSATPRSLILSNSNRPAFRSQSPKKSPHKSPHKSSHKSPHKSPRKSPAKAKGIIPGKTGGSRPHRVSCGSLASPGNVVSYETELIPPPIFPPLKSLAPSSSLLPTFFVLPPPSPRASLPTGPVLPSGPEDSSVEGKAPLSPPIVEVSPPGDGPGVIDPVTPAPIRRPFPVAKPFAQRMVHAYSPAQPSPLSRILMLADSPTTPPKVVPANNSLSPILDSNEDDSQDSLEKAILGVAKPALPVLSPEDMGCGPPKGLSAQGRVFIPEANGKKTKTEAGRPRSSAVLEKENLKQKVSKPSGDGNIVRKALPLPNDSLPSKPTVKAISTTSTVSKGRPAAKPLGDGPRRVPINSANAPVIGKVWKG